MLDKERYQQWVLDSRTQDFFQYLRDYRLEMMERWAQGGLIGNDNLLAIARAQMADEIVNLDDDSISEFYRKQKKEEAHE